MSLGFTVIFTGALPPYSTAGTRPARRRRLAASLPVPSRFAMLSARISMMSSLCSRLDEHIRHGLFVVNAADRLGDQWTDREHPDLADLLVRGERDGVGDDDFLEHGLADALDS